MKTKTMGILAYYRRFNEDFSTRVGFGRSRQTYQRYRIVCQHLSTYIQEKYGKDDLPLSAARPSFIDGFDVWLRTRRTLAPGSVWGYMIALKHVVGLARNEGLLTVNPFAAYVNRYSGKDRGYLSEEELLQFMQVETRTGTEELVRDLFLFSAFTGLAYIDLKNLRREHVRKMFDGHWWIVIRRHKTQTESAVRLLEVPRRLVEKYKDSQPDGRLFPVPSDNCCNENLRHMAARCGFRTHVTFHVGRHTFATLALNRGMPIESLSRILGHTNIRTTQIYARITNKKISEDMALLAEQLDYLYSEPGSAVSQGDFSRKGSETVSSIS